MDPSSLIFAVIVGIWAVYLVQHWVRRREQVATSRSIDRFSEDLRVLERRVPIPIELPRRGQPANRSYVVASVASPSSAPRTLTAPVRPEVAMKQPALPAQPARTAGHPATSPIVTRPTATRPTAIRPTARRRTHRLRALILLALVVATPCVWIAHVFGTLLLWPAVLVSAVALVDLLLVRSAIRRERIRQARVGRRAERSSPPVDPRRPAQRPRPAAASRSQRVQGEFAAAPSQVAEVVKVAGVVKVAEEFAGVGSGSMTATAMHSQDAPTEVILLEGQWQPVAVPPPTYTLKPKAERAPRRAAAEPEPESDSAPVRPSTPPLQPAVVIGDFDLDAVLDRRRAAGA